MPMNDAMIAWLQRNKAMAGSSGSVLATPAPTGSDQGTGTVTIPEVTIVGDSQSNQSVDPSAGQPNQSVDPDAGQPNQSVDPSAGQPNQSVDPNAGQPNQSVDPNAGQANQSVDPNAGQQNQAITVTTDQPGQSMGPEMTLAGASVSPILVTPQPPPSIDPGNLQLPKIPEPFPNGPTGNPEPLGDTEPAPDMNPGETSAGADAEETVLEESTGLAEEAPLAEEGLALIPEEATIPVVGWILIGATLLLVGYLAYKAYIVTKEGKPIRPATPEEEEQAKANEGKPIPTAQDPQTGEPLYTPGDGEYSPAIDPATGQPFQAPGADQGQAPVSDPSPDEPAVAPGQTAPEPALASDTDHNICKYPPPVCDRVQDEDTGNVAVYIYHDPPIPRNEWADAIDSWDAEGVLEHSAEELEKSIANREEIQKEEGETSVSEEGTGRGAAHRVRIEYERDLLGAIQKKLSGS